MRSEKRRVFLVIGNTSMAELYKTILVGTDYVIKSWVYKDQLEYLTSKNTTKVVEEISSFGSQLIICDLLGYGSYSTEILEFLLEIRKAYGSKGHPIILVIYPRDWRYYEEYSSIVNVLMPGPVAIDEFIEIVVSRLG